jgi:hypothetical protein
MELIYCLFGIYFGKKTFTNAYYFEKMAYMSYNQSKLLTINLRLLNPIFNYEKNPLFMCNNLVFKYCS